jgi:outer membrane autotransporter protein
MNTFHRSLWNPSLGACVAVSEITQARGKRCSGGIRRNGGTVKGSRLCLAVRFGTLGLVAGLGSFSAMATCATAGVTVTCTGVPSVPLFLNTFSSASNGLTVNVEPGAQMNSSTGGTAVQLTGTNITLNNSGTIDPFILGATWDLSNAVVLGNATASTVSINNNATGVIRGTTDSLGTFLTTFQGFALNVNNGAAGTTTFVNNGTIESTALNGVTGLIPADAPVVAMYGGNQISMTNAGTITGRVAFGASSSGNNFVNSGTITGSVSLGPGSSNTFTAVTGSSVSAGGGTGSSLVALLPYSLTFAATGQIDGGAGGNNTLILQNTVGVGGGTSGTGTASSATYGNFNNLTVNSGTWTLNGPLVSGNTTLNGGVALFNDNATFGSGLLTSNGGTVQASTAGLVMNNLVALGSGGLTVQGSNGFTLGGGISGTGTLTKFSTGTLTLSGTNTYSGGTNVFVGTLAGTTASLQGNITNHAAVNFDQATSGTYAGVISGGGALTKSGTGTVTLSGANTYSGGTTVSGGTLAGTTASLQGNITNNAAVTFDQSSNGTYAGVMGGTGALAKTGIGNLTLSGANTYSVGTTLNGGTLTVGIGGSIGAGAVTVASASTLDNSGTLTLNNNITLNSDLNLGGSNALTLNGTVSGTGGMVKNGVGSLTLSGNNTFAGLLDIQAGSVSATSAGALANTSGANVGAGGLLSLGANTNLASLTGAGTVSIGAGNTLNLGGGNFAGSFAGDLTGPGALTKLGTGNVILTGASTYNGATAVNAGTLSVNGSIANSTVTVNSGGTLGGSGTLGTTSILSGGVLAPGNSIGTLTVSGNLSFAAGSIYRVEVDAAGANDRINATGTATINGGTVDVQAGAGTYQASTQYTILNAAGGRTGNFAGVTSNLAFLTPTLSYDANNVFLTLARNDISFSAVAITPNQIATSTALQSAGNTGDMATVQTALTGLSAAQARAAYDSVSGTGIVALRRAGAGLAASFGSQLQARLGAPGNAAPGLANSFAGRPMLLAANDHLPDLMAPASDPAPQKFSLAGGASSTDAATAVTGKGLWVRGFGGHGNTHGDGNAAASDLRSSGLSIGFDAEVVDGVRIGVAVTGGAARLSTDNNESGKTRGSAVAVYGSYASGPWSFSGSASMGWGKSHMTRSVVVGGLTRLASSRFDSHTLAAYGEAGYSIAMNGWTLQPLAGLSLIRNKSDGFTETGAGALNLHVAGQTINSSKAMLGAKTSFDTGHVRLEPRMMWAHEFGDLNTPMTSQFQGAASALPFQISGAAVKRDTLILGLGASGSIRKGVDLFADVQAEHNSAQRNLAVLVGLRSRW